MISKSYFATKLAGHSEKTNTCTRSAKKGASNSNSKYSPSLRTLLYGRKWTQALARISSHPEESEIQDSMGDLPLHEVCHTGGAPFQIIQRLIHANKSALQKRGFCGRLPLHYAAYSKPSVNVIKLLLRHYPEAAKRLDDDGRLPLHLAVIRNAPKQSMQAIIDANPAALLAKNKFGSTPVMLARNEHVAELLSDEANKPRNIKKKIEAEKKLVGVWSHTAHNPVATRNKSEESHRTRTTSRHRKPERSQRNVHVYKKKSGKFERKQKTLSELQQNSSELLRVGSPSSVDSPRSPMEIMTSTSSSKNKSIPSPGRGAGNYGGKSAMSSYRASHLPKGIPSPEKGAGNYGGPIMSSNRRRKNLPSPSRFGIELTAQ